MKPIALVTAVILGCLMPLADASSEVRLPALFSDHMVLQRASEVPVWGWAEPGERVTVEFAGQSRSAIAGADGRWQVKLGALEAGFEPRRLVVSGRNSIVIEDILVGEVWLASGQSNMWWPVSRAADARAETAAADHPGIRLFEVASSADDQPRADSTGRWTTCTPGSAGSFSAVAYFFGRQLHQALNVPVGLVSASVRGTIVETWMAREDIAPLAPVSPVPQQWASRLSHWTLPLYPEPGRNIHENWRKALKGLSDYMAVYEALAAEGKQPPRDYMSPEYLAEVSQHQAVYKVLRGEGMSVFFNGMIHPLAPYALRGVIWYQGEANAPREGYRELLAALIAGWRRLWGQDKFNFLVAGLANYGPPPDGPGDSDWARLREAQFQVHRELPRVGLATTIDIGEAGTIHPGNKQEVGRRLALAALNMVYGQPVIFSGPIFRAAEKTAAGLAITFEHALDGLVTSDDGPVKGFAVAGANKKWHWAQAVIKNDMVLLTCADVPDPAAARYAWADNPPANLYNRAGLPAVPFRTDDWPRGE